MQKTHNVHMDKALVVKLFIYKNSKGKKKKCKNPKIT